jgi:hypothetical protein
MFERQVLYPWSPTSSLFPFFIRGSCYRVPVLTLVILATQEAEIRKIAGQSQPGRTV